MSDDIYSDEGTVYPVDRGEIIGKAGNTGNSYGPHLQFNGGQYAHLVNREPYPLENMAIEIHQTAVVKGFWQDPVPMDQYAAKLALIHSEVTEILEALRKRQGEDKVTEEFADVIIRLLDLFDVLADNGEAAPNIDQVVREKMEKNAQRPPRHGHHWG